MIYSDIVYSKADRSQLVSTRNIQIKAKLWQFQSWLKWCSIDKVRQTHKVIGDEKARDNSEILVYRLRIKNGTEFSG